MNQSMYRLFLNYIGKMLKKSQTFCFKPRCMNIFVRQCMYVPLFSFRIKRTFPNKAMLMVVKSWCLLAGDNLNSCNFFFYHFSQNDTFTSSSDCMWSLAIIFIFRLSYFALSDFGDLKWLAEKMQFVVPTRRTKIDVRATISSINCYLINEKWMV